ncbi:TPA: exosome complex protein Rrp42 [Candidatus Woesearchaeota archaeon]|nr:exosome complex protein Rrp42 [Candidatus Woesearchaeota archaeon]
MVYTSKEHIISSLKKGVRLDGRKPLEFRPITIETGFISTAEGSARVKVGDTEVLAGVKMAVGKPYSDTPDRGVLMVNAELLSISNPDFEQGPPSIESIEVARVIDRGVRESKTIDDHALCIRAGELVWMVNVDLCPLNTDGNMIDVGALAAIAALKSTRYPSMDGDKVVYGKPTDVRLPVGGIPIPVTIVKIGDTLLVDPSDDEFKTADARLTVTTMEDGRLCAMQKGGDAALSLEEVSQMLDLASEKAEELRELLKKAIR